MEDGKKTEAQKVEGPPQKVEPSLKDVLYDLLIVDNSTLSKKLLIKNLKGLLPGVRIRELSNGREAVDALGGAQFDLVISEIDLPKLDGFKLLEWVREQPRMRMLPFIVYTSDASANSIRQAVKLGATDFILKPAPSDVLARKIHENIVKVREIVAKKREFAKSVSIPVKPQILTRLNEEMSKPEPDLIRIVDIIDNDPALCAKVLKTANSPFFGSGGVTTTERALNILGLKEFKNTVLISLMHDALSGQKPLPEKFWTHSLLTAAAARDIADNKLAEFGFVFKSRAHHQELSNNAYLAGLLHDCGMPLMLQKFDDFDAAAEINNTAFSTETEESRFFTSHAAMGAMMVRTWGIQDIVCDAIHYHHSPEIPPLPDALNVPDANAAELKTLWALLSLSDYIVRLYATTEPCRLDCDALFAETGGIKVLAELKISADRLTALKLHVTNLLRKIESRK
jgi:HD-like signal output (HDOD) protein